MITLVKLKILTPLQKLPKNVRDLGKLIVAKCFEWLPKMQKNVKSGHTACLVPKLQEIRVTRLDDFFIISATRFNTLTIFWKNEHKA